MLIFKTSKTPSSRAKKKKLLNGPVLPVTFIFTVVILCPVVYYCKFLWGNVEKVPCKYVTVEGTGTFGNHFLQYMHLYVEWKKNEERLRAANFSVIIPEVISDTMSKLFENLTIPTFSAQCHNTVFYDVFDVEKFPEQLSDVCYRLDGWEYGYPELIEYGIGNITRDLHFKKSLVGEVNAILGKISAKFESKPTFVCIHYRGTDYVKHINKYIHILYNVPPTYRYYILAMDYFKRKYGDVAFLFITLDHAWLQKHTMPIVGNGFVVINPIKDNDIRKDFILMASCNHNIISYGTYAGNAALLAGGETIVYAEYQGGNKVLGNFGDVLTVAKLMENRWLVGNNSHIGKYSEFYD